MVSFEIKREIEVYICTSQRVCKNSASCFWMPELEYQKQTAKQYHKSQEKVVCKCPSSRKNYVQSWDGIPHNQLIKSSHNE